MFLSVQPVEDDLNAHKLQMKFPNDRNEEVTKVCVLLMAMSMKAALKIPCIPNATFTNRKHNVMQIHCTYKLVIRTSWKAINTNNNHTG